MPTLFLNWFTELDHAAFARINLDWTNSFFDWLFPNITDLHRDPRFLFVLVPLLLLWFWRQRTHALKWFMIAVISVSISDLIAYRVIKASTGRDRPQLAGIELNLRTHAHTGSSFPSNHAANVFAAATALSGGLPLLAPLFFLFAFLVGYSRIYVGVHFPADVLAGALLGIVVALLVRLAFRRWLKKPSDEPTPDAFGLGDSIVRSEATSTRLKNSN